MNKRWLFSALLMGICICLLIGESALRLLGMRYSHRPACSHPVMHHIKSPNDRFVVYGHMNEYGGHEIKYDKNGLSVPLDGEKPDFACSQKIAFMGDSYVEGMEVAYDQTFVGLLSSSAYDHVCLKNFGVGNYSPVIYFLQWKGLVRNFNPTHVFLFISSNDVREDQEFMAKARYENGEIVAVPGPKFHRLRILFRKSYLLSFLKYNWIKMKWLSDIKSHNIEGYIGGYAEENPDIAGTMTEKYILKLSREIGASKAIFTVVGIPSKYRSMKRIITNTNLEFCQKLQRWAVGNSISYLDLLPAFQRESANQKLFFDRDVHFNKKGHYVVFETIRAAYPDLFRKNT